MGKPDRIVRVNELVKREVAELIEREVRDLGVLVSVTEVKTSVDLRHAKVYVSVLGGDAGQRRKLLALLKRDRVGVQAAMAKHLSLKYTPVLEFIVDKKVEEADRVLSIISEIEDDTGIEE